MMICAKHQKTLIALEWKQIQKGCFKTNKIYLISMNKREQQLFVAFLEQIYESQEIIDFIKLQLVQSLGYNPNLIFDLISQRTSSITIQQLRMFLLDRVACNERQLYQIFEKFDSSRSGSISRQDFLNEIKPFGKSIKSLNLQNGTITAEIQAHFISLMVEIIKRLRILQVSRKEIAFIAPYDAFAHIEHLKSGLIGLNQLKKIFEDNDFPISNRQLAFLLHGLRRRCYRDVNLEVFCQNINPLEFGQYLAYANQISAELEKQFLSRSRREEETVRRSRLQNQKIEHGIQKAERKKQAEVERHFELEERINKEIITHEEHKQRQIRRALLEEDKNIRHNLPLEKESLRSEELLNLHEKYQNQYLNTIRRKQAQVNSSLVGSAFRREEEIDHSRRRLEFQQEQEIWNQIDRDREARRNIVADKQLDLSRRRIQEESYFERERVYRELELERLRAREDLKLSTRNYSRVQDYEKELERTRFEIQERRSRLNQELSSLRK